MTPHKQRRCSIKYPNPTDYSDWYLVSPRRWFGGVFSDWGGMSWLACRSFLLKLALPVLSSLLAFNHGWSMLENWGISTLYITRMLYLFPSIRRGVLEIFKSERTAIVKNVFCLLEVYRWDCSSMLLTLIASSTCEDQTHSGSRNLQDVQSPRPAKQLASLPQFSLT